MDHIVPSPDTQPVIQVGHTALYVIVERRVNITVTVVVCVNSVEKETNPYSLPCRLKLQRPIKITKMIF
jgi:hypothetical protein